MWLPRTVYQQLLRTLAYERRRVQRLEEALELERHENRTAERHWSDSLLRAKQSFPLQKTPVPAREAELILEPVIDPGVIEAHKQWALEHNLDVDVEQFIRNNSGYSS